MAVTLPPKLAMQVQQFVDRGDYADTEDVLEHALSLLAEEDEKIARVRAALDESAADIAAGRTFELSDELIESIKAGAREMLREGRALNPDVCE